MDLLLYQEHPLSPVSAPLRLCPWNFLTGNADKPTSLQLTMLKITNSALTTLDQLLDLASARSERDVVSLLDREPPAVSVCADKKLVVVALLELVSREDRTHCTAPFPSLLADPQDPGTPRPSTTSSSWTNSMQFHLEAHAIVSFFLRWVDKCSPQ